MDAAIASSFDNVTKPSTGLLESEEKWIELPQIFKLCEQNDWKGVLNRIVQEPASAVQFFLTANGINTTVMHQAISCVGNADLRAEVISAILHQTPQAARLRNGLGYLPLHLICQRRIDFNPEKLERLILELVLAYRQGIAQIGGPGSCTPVHNILKLQVPARLLNILIKHGKQAFFTKDDRGFLPAHVACSHHCSPEIIRMLLQVNPEAIFDETSAGESLLDLAESTTNNISPNSLLIKELEKQIGTQITAGVKGKVMRKSSILGAPSSSQQSLPMLYSWQVTTHYENAGSPSIPHLPRRNEPAMVHVPMRQSARAAHHSPYQNRARDFLVNAPVTQHTEVTEIRKFTKFGPPDPTQNSWSMRCSTIRSPKNGFSYVDTSSYSDHSHGVRCPLPTEDARATGADLHTKRTPDFVTVSPSGVLVEGSPLGRSIMEIAHLGKRQAEHAGDTPIEDHKSRKVSWGITDSYLSPAAHQTTAPRLAGCTERSPNAGRYMPFGGPVAATPAATPAESYEAKIAHLRKRLAEYDSALYSDIPPVDEMNNHSDRSCHDAMPVSGFNPSPDKVLSSPIEPKTSQSILTSQADQASISSSTQGPDEGPSRSCVPDAIQSVRS